MSKENLLLIEEVLDAEKSKEDRQIILEGLKDQIKEFEKDADADFQEEIDRVKSKFGIGGAKKKPTQTVEKKPTPKPKAKTTKTPRAKTTPEQKAKNREKVQNATGKTIEECKEILAKYEALRGKTTQKDKQRVDKLKDEDKIIDGTNVKTADAITETTAKQVPKKIKQEVDAIEKEAEKEAKKEVNPKGKTKAEVKKEVEEVKIEKIEEKVKDMTKDLADKSNELIDAMTNTITKFSPSKEEAIKFLMDIRNHIDVLLKSNKFEFGGAVQSYDIAWAGGGRPMPMFEKGGKFADKKIVQLEDGNYYEEITVDRRNEDGISQPYVYYQEIEEKSKGGKFADGGKVEWSKEFGKPSVIVDGFEQGSIASAIHHYTVNSRKGSPNREENLLILKELQKLKSTLGSEYSYSKGGKFADGGTTRKKGLGWKRDRERLSKEPHEQAYKSKRKGDYSSFAKGGVTASSDIIDVAIYWLDENEPLQGELYSTNSKELSKKLKSGSRDKQTILELKDILYANGQNDDNSIELEGHSVSVYGEEGVDDYIRGEDIYYAINEDEYAKGGKFADGGMVNSNGEHYNYLEYTTKMDYNNETLYDVKIGISEDKEFGGEFLNEYEELYINDIEDIFGNEIAQRVANGYGRDYVDGDYRSKVIFVNDGLYKKGGTTRKKGLGWKRDRERISQEPHEQAYKSKRKGDYSSFERGGYYGGDGEEYIYPSEEERIDEMAKHWNSEGWASSSVSKQGDDGEFFDKIGVDSDEVGITSQTGNDIIYYDVNRPSYFNRDFAKGGKTDFIQDVVDSPNFREGAFTRKAEARGMSTDAFMNQVLHSPNLYDERTRKQAQFMKNAFND